MKTLYILGFGCGDKSEVTLKTLDILKKSDMVFVRTVKHPGAEILDEYDIPYTSFDKFYDTMSDFDGLYRAICDEVLFCEADTVSYIVPGSAVIAEKSVFLLLKNAACKVKIIPSTSFLDGLFASIQYDAASSFKLLDALSLDEQRPDVSCMNVVCQVYDRQIASDVKLALNEYYDDETDVFMINACGTDEESIQSIKLYEIDRTDNIDHLSTLVIPAQNYMNTPSDFYSLSHIISALRGENGCPWDKEQTHISLRQYMIEEAYEAVNAIDNNDAENLCEELGDMLLQILLHAQIAKEKGYFDINEVIKGISEKMIRRHPHVFAQKELPDDFYQMWDEVKKKEHDYKSPSEEIEDIPKCLPALIYAQKLYKKAVKAGPNTGSTDDILNKLSRKFAELQRACMSEKKENMYEISGDFLRLTAELSAEYSIDAEGALRDSTLRYKERFKQEDRTKGA